MSKTDQSPKLYNWESEDNEDSDDNFDIIEDSQIQELKDQLKAQKEQFNGQVKSLEDVISKLENQLVKSQEERQQVEEKHQSQQDELLKKISSFEDQLSKNTELQQEIQNQKKLLQQYEKEGMTLQGNKPQQNTTNQYDSVQEVNQLKKELETSLQDKMKILEKLNQECINNDLSVLTIKKLQSMLEEQTKQCGQCMQQLQDSQLQAQQLNCENAKLRQRNHALVEELSQKDEKLSQLQNYVNKNGKEEDKQTIENQKNQIKLQKIMINEMDPSSYYDIIHSKVIKETVMNENSPQNTLHLSLLKSVYKVLTIFQKNLAQQDIHLKFYLKLEGDQEEFQTLLECKSHDEINLIDTNESETDSHNNSIHYHDNNDNYKFTDCVKKNKQEEISK